MDKRTKIKAIAAFEVRTTVNTNNIIQDRLGACISCVERHNCKEIGNSSVCEVSKLSRKQGVLDLGLADNAKFNAISDSIS